MRAATAGTTHTVGESGARGTKLSDYTISIICRDSGETVAQGTKTPVSVKVLQKHAVECTITNSNKKPPPIDPLEPGEGSLVPMVECVQQSSNGWTARWGYENLTNTPITLQIGAGGKNLFTPGAADRGQPTTFAAGRHRDVFTTPLGSKAGPLTWKINGATTNGSATASSSSPHCKNLPDPSPRRRPRPCSRRCRPHRTLLLLRPR